MDVRQLLDAAADALLDASRQLTPAELAVLAALPPTSVPALAALAHEVRLAWCGPEVEVEGILSAKTGGCPEDCHFCSQSAQLRVTGEGDAVPRRRRARRAPPRRRRGSARREFCIVLAVRGPDRARDATSSSMLVPLVRERTGLNVAVQRGHPRPRDQAGGSADGGVHRYNHNLETARSFFPEIVTTHTWDERFDTCALVRDVGMELCCGVLLGMGESVAQRLELLGQLREVEPAEVPINFLNPRPGTPLGDRAAGRAARRDSLDRAVPPRRCPAVILRYAGGREVTLARAAGAWA